MRDIDGDGEINPNDDRTIIGSTQPDFIYGISSSLTLGRWDFFVSLQGSQGNEVYNKLRRHLVESEGASRGRNRSAELLNAWTTTNHTSTPALGEVVSSTYVYSRFIEDGSFLKLRNLSAGYTLPVRCGQQAFKLRLFASAQNLLTITRYKGYDPEVSGGVDTGMYPMARSFSEDSDLHSKHKFSISIVFNLKFQAMKKLLLRGLLALSVSSFIVGCSDNNSDPSTDPGSTDNIPVPTSTSEATALVNAQYGPLQTLSSSYSFLLDSSTETTVCFEDAGDEPEAADRISLS